jgi:hypothetical protein
MKRVRVRFIAPLMTITSLVSFAAQSQKAAGHGAASAAGQGPLAQIIKPKLSEGDLCPKWAEAVRQGDLDSKTLDEASGLSISRSQESFYHMNDSGTKPEFFVTKPDGSQLRKVKIDDYKPLDPEELTMGPCPLAKEKTCLVIADIGDNLKRRTSIAFVFIEERNPWPETVKPHLVARFRYPDEAHNAEAATLLNNGDLVIFTKELSLIGNNASPALVYRATHDQVLKAEKTVLPLEKIGTIDIPKIVKQDSLGGGVTGVAMTQSNERFALLTYSTAIEFKLDLRKPFPKTVADFKIVPLFQLPQQESIAYDRGDRDLVYGSEIKLIQRYFGKGQPAPMYKVKCSP